jgi:hypothetical protein
MYIPCEPLPPAPARTTPTAPPGAWYTPTEPGWSLRRDAVCYSTTADGCSLMATPKVRRPPRCRTSDATVDWRTDPQADSPSQRTAHRQPSPVGPAASLLRVAPASSSMSPNPPCRVGLPRACARHTRLSPRPPSAWLAGEPIRCGELLTRDDASLYSPYRSLFCD